MKKLEYRRIFDTIPEQFDKFRPRYSPELFADLAAYADLGPGKAVLEIGPGTGQATDPVLQTGCDYHGIELGERLYRKMLQKYSGYPNFSLVNDDFITHDFGGQTFDLVYSAATIQWIPEETAFSKRHALLRPGGTLAMMLTVSDYKTPNEELYRNIQQVYSEYFRPETVYSGMKAPFDYRHAADYGFTGFERREYRGVRVMNADTYAAFCGTHCDHLVIPEPYRSKFFDGLRRAVLEAWDRIEFRDTHVMYLARK